MAVTANRGYAKPALTDPPNGPTQVGALADDIDTDMAALFAGTATPTGHAVSKFSFSLAHGTGTNATGWTAEDDTLNMTQADGLHVPVAGVYLIVAIATIPVNTTGYRSLGVRVGGTLRGTVSQPPVTGDATELSATIAYRMAAGAVAVPRVFQNSGGSLTVTGRMSVTYLHP